MTNTLSSLAFSSLVAFTLAAAASSPAEATVFAATGSGVYVDTVNTRNVVKVSDFWYRHHSRPFQTSRAGVYFEFGTGGYRRPSYVSPYYVRPQVYAPRPYYVQPPVYAPRPYYAQYPAYVPRPYVARQRVYVRPRYVAPRPVYQVSTAHANWCYSRYRTYRAWDNTFQPNRGPRRACRSPYMN